MTQKRSYRRKYASYAASLLAAGSLVASPFVVPAFAARALDTASSSLFTTFTPAGVDSRLAAKFENQALSKLGDQFRFTPAGISNNSGRTMTVAARKNSGLGSNAVSVRNALSDLEAGNGKALRLHPSDYRLTAARGWQGFVLATTPKIAAPKPVSEIAVRGNFRLDEEAKAKPSRFSTNVKLDQKRDAAPPARGNAASGDYSLDLGGSFSISRRIDVTAGVRYNSERDRVLPKADNRDDSEAVYVGTKIRF